MPRVKLDYVVSFSSEDPEHPASNLLSWEVSKKKWLCAAGETSASVVLQLEKAVQIGSVSVGAHHAALVEVLVGRSETPAHPYQVLVASSVFLSPSKSRKAEGAGAERVRTFSPGGGGGGVAATDAWAQRWDRLRLVISQPYNKHCKLGVSFVHVFTPEAHPAAPAAPRAGAAALAAAAAALSEDEDEDRFKPGELFAQHKLQPHTTTTRDTGSQIRRATSHVLRTASDGAGAGGGAGAGARLVRRPAPAAAPAPAPAPPGDSDVTIDHNKRKRDTSGGTRYKRSRRSSDDSGHEPGTSRDARRTESQTSPHTRERRERDAHRHASTDQSEENRERTKTNDLEEKRRRGAGVLAGVVCVLSGYENPRRAAVRAAALALGARVHRAWGPACTHLICAFPNTPKLAAVRRGAGGARVPAVTARWLDECARRGERLPEEWFSTEPERRVPPPPASAPPPPPPGDEDEDTDDEIERVLRRQRAPAAAARDADDDHRKQGSQSEHSDEEGATDAEPEPGEPERPGIDGSRALPPLLRDMVFVTAGPHVDRYVRAYAGTILPMEEVEGGGREGDVYALCGGGGGGARALRLRWLWRAHAERRLPPLDDYLIASCSPPGASGATGTVDLSIPPPPHSQ